MSPREIGWHVQKKLRTRADRHGPPDFSHLSLAPAACFPVLPDRAAAPAELVENLRHDLTEILSGRWKAFGHLPMEVSDPPRWQYDHLAQRDFQTNRSAFDLDHRAQPGGADIKVIWEPSRWFQLVRLAMGAWLLEDRAAAAKCVAWLEDWVRTNPPYTGLNWTSGLEIGIRLIQFVWIDAFLSAAGVESQTLERLRRAVVPAHLRHAWRFRSFGSSANNHLIGELAGAILALVRYPRLSSAAAPLAEVQAEWEREVLLQFAPDGGNREQAHGYHLFSWEFCWQAQEALHAAGLKISDAVRERLIRAGEFYRELKPEGDVWEYGDCDNAFVTPLFARDTEAADAWWQWFGDSAPGSALRYFWGRFPGRPKREAGFWKVYADSGFATFESGPWFARFDFSPLGYLTMAPHGHLDALHLSLWHHGEPIVIDPGTGTYYADPPLRAYLADWAAHNGPHPKTPPLPFPRRFGMFLWGEHHARPVAKAEGLAIGAEIQLPYGTGRRRITFAPEKHGFIIEDEFAQGPAGPVATRWKFAPGLSVETQTDRSVMVQGSSAHIRFTPSQTWSGVRAVNPGTTPDPEAMVSPAFRAAMPAAYLHLESTSPGPLKLVISDR